MSLKCLSISLTLVIITSWHQLGNISATAEKCCHVLQVKDDFWVGDHMRQTEAIHLGYECRSQTLPQLRSKSYCER
jgi:hypothetical protein